MMLQQIFDAINLGIVILDRDFRVRAWNRWMEIHSGIAYDEIKGNSIFDRFSHLNNPKFIRSCKSVFAFGNFCFFSQKLHHHLFPFKTTGYADTRFEHMQQSCAMGPLRDGDNEINHLFIYVQDMTEVATYEQKLMEMNLKDGLTGIYNRRFLDEKLNEEFNRHKRYGGVFSVVMLDIDHFKSINDTYGHQCGDFILKSLSSRTSSLIRNVDFMVRYGGEEFCCLLPETKMHDALKVAERFRVAIEQQENNYDGKIIKVTISLGVAEFRKEMESAYMMFKKADEALYRAKREGRNRVMEMDWPGAVLSLPEEEGVR
ncbi:MAG: sensor domain-containing diguanylate cyclase [Nitrospiraceae bacterium]|nr:MAG: sensor domain-containing diguanylate cyclase [Nitrospiraceae bacterium]